MSTWKTGTVILGEYTVEKELGRGGMGRVWLVKSHSTGRRFAVKQALIRDEKHRKAFLTELQTWIDLPEHPNIVPCRFFRTVADEIVIFADYIEGGSLADWIAKGKLTGLEQVLDVAIQFAWGLHAIHERGLIHQDVKPGNVLMTPEGVPMITDFGLARARLHAVDGALVSPALPPDQQSVLVSFGGMTPAYASPEQRSGKPLSRKTDIWSWGVSVLDMFMGGVSCPHGGHIAAETLEAYVEQCIETGSIRMPVEVVAVLRSCFEQSPENRPETLRQVAESLAQYLEKLNGTLQPPEGRAEPQPSSHPKAFTRRLGSVEWPDPKEWLRFACEAACVDVDATGTSQEIPGEVSDISIFQQALDILTNAVSHGGRTELLPALASLQNDKALVHEKMGDVVGANRAYDGAIAACLSHGGSSEQDRPELLARAYEGKATQCQGAEAVAWYDKAVVILERMNVQHPDDPEIAFALGNVYQRKGSELLVLGETSEALSLFDKATEHLEKSIATHPSAISKLALAAALTNRGSSHLRNADYAKAIMDYDAALAVKNTLAASGELQDPFSIPSTLVNKANALSMMGDKLSAFKCYDEAIKYYIEGGKTGRRHYGLVAAARENCAIILMQVGHAAAGVMLDIAIDEYKTAIDKEGDLRCRQGLAKALMLRKLIQT